MPPKHLQVVRNFLSRTGRKTNDSMRKMRLQIKIATHSKTNIKLIERISLEIKKSRHCRNKVEKSLKFRYYKMGFRLWKQMNLIQPVAFLMTNLHVAL